MAGIRFGGLSRLWPVHKPLLDNNQVWRSNGDCAYGGVFAAAVGTAFPYIYRDNILHADPFNRSAMRASRRNSMEQVLRVLCALSCCHNNLWIY